MNDVIGTGKGRLTADCVRLVGHLQRRHEAERSRLARMLHHDVSGMLAAVRMDLSRAMGRCEDDPESREQLARMDQLIEQVIRDARREMQRLHPALLDHFGLSMALRHQVEQVCQAAGIEPRLDLAEPIDGVAPEAMVATFRCVDALLGDGRGLRSFELRLAPGDSGYELELRREPPLAADAGTSTSHDVQVLRAWLESLGARWRESTHGVRTTVTVGLPRVAVTQDAAPGG